VRLGELIVEIFCELPCRVTQSSEIATGGERGLHRSGQPYGCGPTDALKKGTSRRVRSKDDQKLRDGCL
jgi:hypothetical protein